MLRSVLGLLSRLLGVDRVRDQQCHLSWYGLWGHHVCSWCRSDLGLGRLLIKLLIALLLALPSYLGVRLIGIASLIMMAVVITFTLTFSVWGVAVGDGAFFRLSEARTLDGSNTDGDNVDWSQMVQWLFMNFDRLQLISMIGGEIRNPARTYPRVISITVVLVLVLYKAAFIGAVVADKTPWREITKDSYPSIGDTFGGPVLHAIMVLCSVASLIGLFANSVFLHSCLIQGVAQSRLLPVILRKRSTRFKTPKYALLSSLLVTMAVMLLQFDIMLYMLNAFSSAVQVLIVLSMLQLRHLFPNLHRPVRVPGKIVTLALMLRAVFSCT